MFGIRVEMHRVRKVFVQPSKTRRFPRLKFHLFKTLDTLTGDVTRPGQSLTREPEAESNSAAHIVKWPQLVGLTRRETGHRNVAGFQL